MKYEIWYGDREKPIDTIEAVNISVARQLARLKLSIALSHKEA